MIPLYINGRVLDVMAMGPADVDVQDLASTLAKVNRFIGHTPEPYSVAQHAVLVSHLVPEEHALCALHHDDTEAFLGDMASPVKAMFPRFSRLEDRLWRQAIAPAFGLPERMPECVHLADKDALLFEQRWIQGREDVDWTWFDGLPNRFDYAWDWKLARLRYWTRHEELVHAR